MIELVQGDSRTVTVTVKTASGAAYDLTGCLVLATVKRAYEDADASALISATLTVSVPASGVAYWTITSAQTLPMLGLYKYDIQLKTAAGAIETLVVGDFNVLPHVTIRTT